MARGTRRWSRFQQLKLAAGVVTLAVLFYWFVYSFTDDAPTYITILVGLVVVALAVVLLQAARGRNG